MEITKKPIQELEWTNYYGVTKKTSELDDQHLCNMMWYAEVFLGWTRETYPLFVLRLEWHGRCQDKAGRQLNDGEIERLPWKPLPIPREIEELKRLGMVKDNGDIVRDNEVIGTITHIENWKELV